MDLVKSCLLVLSLPLIGCGPAPDMPEYKSATVPLLNNEDEKIFYVLPQKAQVFDKERIWSGDFWPSNKGLINFRWNSPLQETFQYTSPSRDELLLMTPDLVAQLSPAEKFDLLKGRYEYPLKEEVYSYANQYAQNWESIANGWAMASLNHKEPTPKVLINPDGVPIPFGSSDIKALLTYYYAFFHNPHISQQMGESCGWRDHWPYRNHSCEDDVNAGAFHVYLTNKVGMKNESFLVDVDRYKEIWNHPVMGYVYRIEKELTPDPKSPPGTTKVLHIRIKISYADQAKKNSWEPLKGTRDQGVLAQEYSYFLFLNLKNEIIGGEWISKERPDFLWTPGPVKSFKGLLDGLKQLLND